MRTITLIIIHCSATPEGKFLSAEACRQDHIQHRGFRDIGYHFYITRDGEICQGRPLEKVGAHCRDHNTHSIGICYEGGLDIAGLTGMCIGGALWHVPIVLDGVISMAAALVAERLFPGVREYLIPSDQGKEPAAVKLADALQLSPVIHAGMALGEGTGAVMMFTLLDMAMSIYGQSATFSEIKVEQYRR